MQDHDMTARLEALTERITIRQLEQLLRTLNGGTPGVNVDGKTKTFLVTWGADRYGADRFAQALEGFLHNAGLADSRVPAEPPRLPINVTPAPAKPGAKTPGELMAEAVAAIAAGQAQSVDVDTVLGIVNDALFGERARTDRLIADAMANVPARKLDISVNGKAPVTMNGAHPLLEKVLRLVNCGLNVLLVGPAGSGKTHLAGDVAKALGRSFGSISLSAGITESALVGRLLPIGEGGAFGYVSSPFVREYETGGVFLFDELDAADPNMLLVVNQALSNGGFDIEQKAVSGAQTYVTRHTDTVMIGAANTFGTGATAQYVGRSALDAATLDRWYIVHVDYDRTYEDSLLGSDRADRALGEWVWNLRERVGRNGIERVVSTRMIQKAVNARRAGLDSAEIKRDLLAGWSATDLRAVGESV